MKKLVLVFRLLVIAIAFVFTVLFFIAKGEIEDKDIRLKAIEDAHAHTQNELDEKKEEIDELKTILASEQGKLTRSKRQLESARAEMYAAKQGIVHAENRLKEAKQQIRDLKIDLQATRNKLLASERTVASIDNNGEIASLKERVKELELANQLLESSVPDKRRRSK